MPLKVGTNAYVTRDEADAYFAESLKSSGWQAASVILRDRALIAGTAALDRLGFAGMIAHRNQPLAWPRIRMRDREGRAISSLDVPDAVKAASCELALHLLNAPAVPSSPAIIRKRVGDLELQYRATVHDPVPPIVRELLAPFLAGSPHSVELVP